MKTIKTYKEVEEKIRREIEEDTWRLTNNKEVIYKINEKIAEQRTLVAGICVVLGTIVTTCTLLLGFLTNTSPAWKAFWLITAIAFIFLIIKMSTANQLQMRLLALEEIKKEYEQKENNQDDDKTNEIIEKERLTAIRNMIDLGLTKEQILRKYTKEEYVQAKESLLVHS